MASQEENTGKFTTIDWILIAVVTIVLAAAGTTLYQNLRSQDSVYDQMIMKMSNSKDIGNVDSAVVILAFSRARDFANMKAASMLVGFLLIFTGALFLLKVFSTAYKLTADKTPAGSFGLESSSPGLVMVTLGVAIMGIVLITKTDVDLDMPAKKQLSAALKQIDSLANKIRLIDSSMTKPTRSKEPLFSTNTFIGSTDSPTKQADAIAARMKTDPSVQVDLIEQGGGSAHELKVLDDMIRSLRLALINAGIADNRIHLTSRGESHPVADDNFQKAGILIKFKK